MFKRFFRDQRGNFAMITGISMLPIFGALAIAIDYTQIQHQRQDALNALDAAGIATARRVLEGATDAVVKQYARDFFDANLGAVDPKDAALTVTLPANIGGGGKVRLEATMQYHPQFLPPFLGLLNGNADSSGDTIQFVAVSEVQLKNTVEVALVLDNSGSMDYYGTGSGTKRIELLKTASTTLVEKLAKTAEMMKQVEKPVQFSLVPFAASVNVGATNKTELWMDTTGISPIHHENFDWTTMPANKQIKQLVTGGSYVKQGNGWPAAEKNTVVTRFSLFGDLKRKAQTSTTQECTTKNGKKTCVDVPVYAGSPLAYASWQGCVETRPSPYNTNDAAATPGTPSTLFVPMFGPDEAGDTWKTSSSNVRDDYDAENSWWNDGIEGNDAKVRQRYSKKYFDVALGLSAAGTGEGPNASCTTNAITPLTDVTTTAGMTKIKNAINAMAPLGATNVPEGLAWGWRTLSSQAPFTDGRAETEKGNDKVVIVLTDGANTYYTPSSLGYTDDADNKSTYSAYGYVKPNTGVGRIFQGTSVSQTDYSNANYSNAMNEQFSATCVKANGGDTGGQGAGLIVMTVALDLDPNKKPSDPSKNATADEKKQTEGQLAMLKTCASRSRYAKDPNEPTKGKKLFWNATGANLNEVFKQIADELSNLRIVG